MQNKEDTQ